MQSINKVEWRQREAGPVISQVSPNLSNEMI